MPDDNEGQQQEPETQDEPEGEPEGEPESVEGDADTGSSAEGDTGEPDQPTGQTRKQPAKQQSQNGETDLDRVRKALTAERASRKKLERDMAALRRQHATAEERAILEAKEAAATEREAEVKPPLLKALAAAELRAAGVQGSTPARLVGLLDMDKVDIDEDGNLVGLDDQIAGLKDEFPNLFAAPSDGKTRPTQANAGSGSSGGRKQDKGGDTGPKPWYEQLADQVLNAGGTPGVGRR